MSEAWKAGEGPLPLRPRVWARPWADSYAVALVAYDLGARTRYVVTAVTTEEFGEGDEIHPTFEVPREDIQQMMDELWRAGVRPTEVGTAGHVEAVEERAAHLERILDQVLPRALREKVE